MQNSVNCTITLTPAQQMLLCAANSQYTNVTNAFYNSVMSNQHITQTRQNALRSQVFQQNVAHALSPIYFAALHTVTFPSNTTLTLNVQFSVTELVAFTTFLAQYRAQYAQNLINAYTSCGVVPADTNVCEFQLQLIDSILAQLK